MKKYIPPRKRRKSQTDLDLYEPELVDSGLFYLKNIVQEFDISAHFNYPFLRLIDRKTLLKIAPTFFQPVQDKKLQELQEDEEPTMRTNHRGFRGRPLFDSLGKPFPNANEIENDLETYFGEDPQGPEKIQNFFLSDLTNRTKGFDPTQTSSYQKIKSTFETLGLPQKYESFLHLLYVLEDFPPLSDWIWKRVDDDLSMNYVLRICGLHRNDLSKLTHARSKFVTFGIIEESHRNPFDRRPEITNSFRHFLADPNLKSFGMRLVKEDKSEAQPIESFFISEVDKDRIKSLLADNNTAKVLLYGAPGSGKTEFAKSLAQSLGKNLFRIDSQEAEGQERRAALVVGELATREGGGILLMDEADDLLNEGAPLFSFFMKRNATVPEKKIWMNEFLDSLQGKVIFITNESHSIHSSVLRRFDYSMEFFPADQKQREYYWNRVLELEGVKDKLSTSKIQEISESYPTGVGGITTSIRSAKKIDQTSSSEFLPILQDVLTKHTRLIGEKIKKPSLASTPYDRNILHTDADLEGLETLVQNYKTQLQDSRNSSLGSLCLLFYGKPGTGKTEYARYLAKKMDLELFQKRSSDLQSMWVGETEKRIARAFQEAENKKGIFFLDEADTFFRSRELAKNSWEGSQTNEFLTWMETFRGIFIASTNFLKDFDQAALRRFAWKGEFKPLRRDDKVRILLQYFPSLETTLSELEKENVKDIPGLTPGDFRALWNRFRFRDSLSYDEILEALETEASFKTENKKKTIGF